MLSVEQHLRLLSAQFLARALQPHHASHATVLLEQGPRNMKHTLWSKVISDVEPFLVDGVVRPADFSGILSAIHTKIVGKAVDRLQPNRVLNGIPPLIDPSETFLPRAIRATLAQLRSGHCATLKSFLHRILPGLPQCC